MRVLLDNFIGSDFFASHKCSNKRLNLRGEIILGKKAQFIGRFAVLIRSVQSFYYKFCNLNSEIYLILVLQTLNRCLGFLEPKKM